MRLDGWTRHEPVRTGQPAQRRIAADPGRPRPRNQLPALTVPLGAPVADWIGKPKYVGGLGVGDRPVALTLTFLIACLVAYLVVILKDV